MSNSLLSAELIAQPIARVIVMRVLGSGLALYSG